MKKRMIAVLCMLAMVFTMAGCASGQKELPENIIDDKYRTFYEVFVYSFYDSDGDGIGDLNGLAQKLDYISDLGCNGIWMMPIMPATSYHKYDVKDYLDIDPEYGTMEEFDAFMAACNERDMHVLIDLVINHTSAEHPWFTEACEYLRGLGESTPSAEDCPYFEYYNFSKEQKSGAWYQVEGTDWYYEAPFWSGMPDLNLYSEAVRSEIAEITRFWLDKGVAGFRLDAAKEYVSDNTPANVDILTWLNDTVKAQKEDAYIVAETWTDLPTYAKYYASGIDSNFNFGFASQEGLIARTLNGTGDGSALAYGKTSAALAGIFSEYGEQWIDAPFYTNHDMGRSAGYYAGEGSEEKTKLAQAMNLLMGGNAFLYYGEELGMKGAGKDENKRAPMYWFENPDKEGMCDGPKDMDAVKMKFPALEEQQKDQNSVYNYVKRVIQVRNAFPAIARGTVECVETVSNEAVCVLKKTYGDQQVVLIYNVSGEAQTLNAAQVEIGEKNLTEVKPVSELYTGKEKMKCKGENLTVPGYSVLVYEVH